MRVAGGALGAIFALPLLGTVTVIVRLRVEARGGVLAWIWAAVIAIDLALIAGETNGTHALIGIDQVATLAAVLTGLRGALVNVRLAIFARVAGRARAVIVVDEIYAQCAVLALTHAVVDVLCAIFAGKAASAFTPAIIYEIISIASFFIFFKWLLLLLCRLEF